MTRSTARRGRWHAWVRSGLFVDVTGRYRTLALTAATEAQASVAGAPLGRLVRGVRAARPKACWQPAAIPAKQVVKGRADREVAQGRARSVNVREHPDQRAISGLWCWAKTALSPAQTKPRSGTFCS